MVEGYEHARADAAASWSIWSPQRGCYWDIAGEAICWGDHVPRLRFADYATAAAFHTKTCISSGAIVVQVLNPWYVVEATITSNNFSHRDMQLCELSATFSSWGLPPPIYARASPLRFLPTRDDSGLKALVLKIRELVLKTTAIIPGICNAGKITDAHFVTVQDFTRRVLPPTIEAAQAAPGYHKQLRTLQIEDNPNQEQET